MADTEKCAHPACACRAEKGSKYCSTFCAGNAGNPDITCNCGHAECEAGALAETSA
jgi:hypothetical protein